MQNHSNALDRRSFKEFRTLCGTCCAAFVMCFSGLVQAATLEKVEYAALPGDKVQITLTMDEAPTEPQSFTIDNPARIAFDFADTSNDLDRKSVKIGLGMARSVNTAEANGRTRVVLNLVKVVPYTTSIEGNSYQIVLDGSGETAEISRAEPAATSTVEATTTSSTTTISDRANNELANIDFRRGEEGEGRVIIEMTNSNAGVDIRREGQKLYIDFMQTDIPARLLRRLDVVDFATPVRMIDTLQLGAKGRVVIEPMDEYEHIAYQSDELLTIEVKPLTEEQIEEAKKDEFGYTGERLTLNFQNIEVRAVLQLIADFTGLNIVVSDTVGGNLTLRLKNVPWDQALDIILKTKGLDMRKAGNVILIAPAEEIAAREKQELEAKQQKEDLAPLRTEFIQINYAKAAEVAGLLKSSESAIISPRGSVTIDDRTNTLLVQDTSEKLDEIRGLISTLDVAVRQVLIESRVVAANDNFSKDLGVRFGNTGSGNVGDTRFGVTGSTTGADTIVQSGSVPAINNRLNTSLPSIPESGAPGRLALAILGSHYLLDLELSALQTEGNGEIISNPRVVTANQQEATIEQGVEIPFQEAASSGATSTSFKKAVLSLTVTPQITPDDRIIMDLSVTKDSVGGLFNGVPSINTQRVLTQVLVNNGETVVLGGVYEQESTNAIQRVPFFGDLPILGVLFRQKTNKDTKRELLIFVTPKILKESLSIN